MEDGEPMTVREVAEFLRVSERYVLKLIKEGQLKAFYVGGRGRKLRVDPAELKAAMERWSGGPQPPIEGV